MKRILKSYVSASNNNHKVALFYIGEGHNGFYDQNDDTDEPLLRIDIFTRDPLDRRRWLDDEYYTSCTTISARVSSLEAKEMCKKVLKQLSKMTRKEIERCGDYCFMKAWEKALSN